MKSIKILATIVLIVAALVLVKIFFLAPKDDKSKAGAKPPTMPVAVNAYVVKAENIPQQVYVSGNVVPYNEIALRSEISGKLIGIYFKDGQSVSKGTLLAKINDADFQAQILKNKAAITLATQRLQRLEKLKAVEGASAEEIDIINNELQTLEADRAYINAQIAKTAIIAPFSGTIGLRAISEGAYVSSNDIIASLIQTKPLYIDFSLPEKYAAGLRKGIEITFQNEGFNEKPISYKAQITAVEPKVDAFTKTLKCRATYYGNQQLFTGSFVKVYVNLGNVKNAILIPTQAIIPILKGQKIFVSKGGLAQELHVSTGIRTAEKIQVLDSLQIGDTVITSGLMGIKKGSQLKIIKTK